MKNRWKYLMAAAVIAGVLTGLAETSGSCQTENAQNEMENIKRVNFIAAIANEGYWGRAADGAIQTGSQKNMDVKCLGQTNLDSQELLDNLEISINSDLDGIISYGLNQSASSKSF